MSAEEPDFTVVSREGDIEYRQYEPYLVAETVIKSSEGYKDAGNEGFRRLFNYISGGNRSQSKIAMTVPVQQSAAGEKIAMTVPVQQSASGEAWTMSFALPAKYTLDTAPQPADSRVTVREIPGRLVAVLRYSGRWTERNFDRKSAELLKQLASQGVETIGKAESAVYNAPFVPPFMRRNEVMVEVENAPTGEAVAAAGY